MVNTLKIRNTYQRNHISTLNETEKTNSVCERARERDERKKKKKKEK